MGLDVYMTRYDNFADTDRRQKEYRERESEIWKRVQNGRKYEDVSTKERDDARVEIRKVAESLGLDQFGTDSSAESIEIPSTKYPDHTFKIGYMRSSYNDGGINSVLRKMVGHDLYSIFGMDQGGYHQLPDWNLVRKNVAEVRKLLDDTKLECGEFFNVHRVTPNPFINPADFPHSANDALATFRKEVKQRREVEEDSRTKGISGGNYSNRDGEFFLEKPIEVYGIIPGAEESLSGKLRGSSELIPVFYLIIKEDLEYYLHALEIIDEMAQYVLSQPHPEQYRLRWSG